MEKELTIKITVKNKKINTDVQIVGFNYQEIIGALFDVITEIQSQHKKAKRKNSKKTINC